jgi:hypothetical protein
VRRFYAIGAPRGIAVTNGKRRSRGDWKHVDGGYAFVIPYTLLRHPKWQVISPHCCKLMLDVGRQYSGFNNGYLCAAWELMRAQGWRSRETLGLAIAEAVHHLLIEKTRQGDRGRPNLYALTWWPIHSKPENPLDAQPTLKPSDAWKADTGRFELPDALKERRSRTTDPSGKKKKTKILMHARRAA